MQSYKSEILKLLHLLASDAEQLAYERNVPHVDITTELVCMWFDDFYDAAQIAADPEFTSSEREALAAFHLFYDARSELLPESHGTIRTWLATSVWREVMDEARKTLGQVRHEPADQ